MLSGSGAFPSGASLFLRVVKASQIIRRDLYTFGSRCFTDKMLQEPPLLCWTETSGKKKRLHVPSKIPEATDFVYFILGTQTALSPQASWFMRFFPELDSTFGRLWWQPRKWKSSFDVQTLRWPQALTYTPQPTVQVLQSDFLAETVKQCMSLSLSVCAHCLHCWTGCLGCACIVDARHSQLDID